MSHTQQQAWLELRLQHARALGESPSCRAPSSAESFHIYVLLESCSCPSMRGTPQISKSLLQVSGEMLGGDTFPIWDHLSTVTTAGVKMAIPSHETVRDFQINPMQHWDESQAFFHGK